MEQDIRENNFLEHGEHNGNLYGTHLDSIRNVIKEGLSFNPQSASKFCPDLFLVFVFRKNVRIGLRTISIEASTQ